MTVAPLAAVTVRPLVLGAGPLAAGMNSTSIVQLAPAARLTVTLVPVPQPGVVEVVDGATSWNGPEKLRE